MGEIFDRVATLQSGNEVAAVAGVAGTETSGGVNMEAEVTIKDIIDER